MSDLSSNTSHEVVRLTLEEGTAIPVVVIHATSTGTTCDGQCRMVRRHDALVPPSRALSALGARLSWHSAADIGEERVPTRVPYARLPHAAGPGTRPDAEVPDWDKRQERLQSLPSARNLGALGDAAHTSAEVDDGFMSAGTTLVNGDVGGLVTVGPDVAVRERVADSSQTMAISAVAVTCTHALGGRLFIDAPSGVRGIAGGLGTILLWAGPLVCREPFGSWRLFFIVIAALCTALHGGNLVGHCDCG